MFGLVAAAACMPAHEDWLNDLSLMPPVSVTMQPVNLAAPVPVPVLELEDELGLAHPAASKATAASAAAARKACLTCLPPLPERLSPAPLGRVPRSLVRTAGPLTARSAHGVEDPRRLLRDDRR